MYLTWKKQTITDFSDQNINELYSQGFLFTRESKGAMYETRSVRVDLSKFELSSENRRILRKSENLKLEVSTLPHPSYDWRIAKFGHDFYTQKFGDKIFSANKIKELLTDQEKSNFNLLLGYQDLTTVGYAICYSNDEILHYSYPFYSLLFTSYSLGMSMMTRAIVWAKENDKKYVYLGSAKDSAALYKFQFKGVEWWNGEMWKTDLEELKNSVK